MGNEHSKTKSSNTSNKNIEQNGKITSNGLEIEANGEAIVQENGYTSLNFVTESTENDYVAEETDTPAAVISEIVETIVQKEPEKQSKEEKVSGFGKMFKKKTEPPADVKVVQEKEISNDDQTDASIPATDPQPETANLKQESESSPEPESVTVSEEEKAPETDDGSSQPLEKQEESTPEENPVMNFFKTLVAPKTPKKETAAPDAAKDQSPKESLPAETTTVAQVSEPPAAPKGMNIPPPPPPEPPKLEVKGDPAAKPAKATAKEEPKAAAKEPEPSKGKSAKVGFGKLFRTKILLGAKSSKGKGASASGAKAQAKTSAVETPVEVPPPEPVVAAVEAGEEVPQPVVEVQAVEEVPQPEVEVEKVDPSKASTLEAAAKPEQPPPVQEEKKPAPKSAFLSLFKPKVLLDHMTTKVQAASTSGVRLLRRTAGVADPKKATPAPAAAAEAPAAKAKEEPKAAAKSTEAPGGSASVAPPAGDDAANVPKKLEKRNSIGLFFKFKSGKRNSTDAGVQTDQATAQAAEKAK